MKRRMTTAFLPASWKVVYCRDEPQPVICNFYSRRDQDPNMLVALAAASTNSLNREAQGTKPTNHHEEPVTELHRFTIDVVICKHSLWEYKHEQDSALYRYQ